MRKIHAFFLFILLVTSPLVADSPIHFKKKLIDFGEVESGRVVCVNFEFKNTGNKTFVIADITAMGGDFQAKLKTRKYRPGKRGSIDVTFNTKGYKGRVTKAITVVVRIIYKEKKNNYSVHRLKLTGLVNLNNPAIAEVNPEKKRVKNYGAISRKQRKIIKNNQRLFKAVKNGKAAKIKKILQKPTSIGARNRCLLMAVGQGHFEIVRSLVEISEEIDLDFQDEEQQTSLKIAFSNNSSDIFYYLIEKGANAQWYVELLVKKRNITELERIRGLNQSLISSGDIKNIKDDLVFEQFGKTVEFSNLIEILKKYPSNRHFAKMLDKVYDLVLMNKNLNEMKQLATSFPNHKLSDELLKQIAWKEKAHEYYLDAKEYEEAKYDPELLEAWIKDNRYSLVNKYRKKYEEAKNRLKEITRLLREFDENKAELSTLRTWVNQNKYVMQDNYKKIYAMVKNRLTALENAQIIQVAQKERLYPYPAYIDVYHPVSREKLPNPGPNDDIFYDLGQTSKRFLELQEILMDTTEWISENSSYKVCRSCLNEAISRSSNLMVLNKKRNFGYYNKCRGAFIQAYNEFKCISGNCVNGKGVKVWTNKVTNRSGIMKGSFVDGYLAKGEFLYYLGLDQKPENLITAEYGQFWRSTAGFEHYLLGMLKKGVRVTADGKREEGGYTVDSTGIIWDDGRIKASDIGKILLAAAAAMIIERLANGNDSATDDTAASSSSDRGSIIFKVEGQWFFGNIKSVKIKLQGQTRYITYEESGSSGYVSFAGIPYETYNVTVYAYEESGLKGKYHSLKATVSHKCKTTDVRITTGSGGLVDPQIYVNCY